MKKNPIIGKKCLKDNTTRHRYNTALGYYALHKREYITHQTTLFDFGLTIKTNNTKQRNKE